MMQPLRCEVVSRRPPVGGALAVWAAAVIGALGLLLTCKTAPVPAADADAWPANAQLVRATGIPTLVLFAHPQSSRTRASLTELATFVAEARGQVAARVVFVQPADVDGDWVHTDGWAQAMAIPGVTVSIDSDGCEGRRFGATTSGQIMLYATDGRLLLRGGNTTGRLDALLATGSANGCSPR